MKRAELLDIALFVLLAAAGAGARIYFHEVHFLPNFAPVAGLALFAGYFFRSWLVAAALPIITMIASDLVIGGYDWRMMLVVYGALTAPVALRPLLRKYLSLEPRQGVGPVTATFGLVGCCLLSSIFFYLLTNFAWWPWSEMYSKDWSGLTACYVAGLPFFKYTLAGDLLFGGALFCGYAFAIQFGWAKMPIPAAA